MKSIVITGSTRGIGFGLVDNFLERGCQVVVSGRTQDGVNNAIAPLADKHGSERILGQTCDVTDYDQVKALWDAAVDSYRKVDIWVNNAGQPGAYQNFWTLAPPHIKEVVTTNLVGTMYGSKVAIEGMLAQGFGAIYNMEGAGSNGRIHGNMTLYASSKRGGNLLIDGLVNELKDTPVIIGALSPGMVVTDFFHLQKGRGGEDWEQTKKIINIIGDKVETVTPWLVDKILENKKNGANIQWASRGKIMWRFMTAGFKKRDLFGDV